MEFGFLICLSRNLLGDTSSAVILQSVRTGVLKTSAFTNPAIGTQSDFNEAVSFTKVAFVSNRLRQDLSSRRQSIYLKSGGQDRSTDVRTGPMTITPARSVRQRRTSPTIPVSSALAEGAGVPRVLNPQLTSREGQS